ncbi:acyl-CoA dehydrogenase [Verticiella sediminum]|uniref:Medium-chain specific acyl-CoA dehydrogenase, mitochondrial n=1 Tax=Verticiella sediminum TaxID=1247510 RepID=A0A556AB36_9BURK|nr:acyl-CoA dehydrogenase family protein [Verticiella sediminum]TSH90106.1 acyl-CoA dehydrogenase [Verticiella sediminum]
MQEHADTTIPAGFEGSAQAARLIEDIRAFIARELVPLAQRLGVDQEHGAERETLRAVWRLSHEAGFYGITLPRAMGGLGLSVVDHLLVKEAIYASGSPFAPHILGELSGPPRLGALVRAATPYHLEHYIKPVAQAQKSVCFAITEVQAGSDAGALQTRARRDGEHYVLDGRKRFISGSPFADCAVILASTAEPGSTEREVTAFFVDLDQPGARVESDYKTMAGQSSTGDIVLENCRVPVRNLIGEPGRGLGMALGRINVNRVLHCAGMLGLARLALDDSLKYARERQQFGKPIATFQAIQHMLADMATDLAAARGLMLATGRALDAGVAVRAEASMSKLFCSEAAFRIADRAVQIHGGEGIVQGRRVEFLFRVLRMYRVLTGTSEIQRNTIARELLGQPAQ